MGFNLSQAEVLFEDETAKAAMHLFSKHLLQKEALETTIGKAQAILLEEMERFLNNNHLSRTENDWVEQNLFEFASAAVFRASAGPLLSMNLLPDYKEYLRLLRVSYC